MGNGLKTEIYGQILADKQDTGLEGLTDEEKSALLGLLRSHKKYGLVWEDKPEAVEEDMKVKLPVLKEVKSLNSATL